MSDTPETQAAILVSNGQWSFALKECCEQLERERDEWRECAERLADSLLRWLPRYGTGMCNDGAEAMAALAEFDLLKKSGK